MLVLTTMFINVSNNLPKTSYMKMVDVWLLFNLLLPFIIVLLHTYMDTLRNDEEREINHHGKSIQVGDDNGDNLDIIEVKRKVSFFLFFIQDKYVHSNQEMPGNLALVSINEKEERRAQQAFYERVEAEMSKKKARKLAFMKRVALVYNPLVAVSFAAVYWVAGLRHAGII